MPGYQPSRPLHIALEFQQMEQLKTIDYTLITASKSPESTTTGVKWLFK